MENRIVTIIGEAYFEPISLLLEQLEKYDNSHSDPIQSGYYENGLSSSICILSVICLESYVMRVRYINGPSENNINQTSVPVYLKELYSDFPFKEELNEIHIVRDLLAHNHLWEISYSQNEKGKENITSCKHSKGDKKYKEHVNDSSNSTKKLGLNVNPLKIGASDAKTVIQTVWKILLFLEGKNKNQCSVSDSSVGYKGEQVEFCKVIGLPETCI